MRLSDLFVKMTEYSEYSPKSFFAIFGYSLVVILLPLIALGVDVSIAFVDVAVATDALLLAIAANFRATEFDAILINMISHSYAFSWTTKKFFVLYDVKRKSQIDGI